MKRQRQIILITAVVGITFACVVIQRTSFGYNLAIKSTSDVRVISDEFFMRSNY
jgi:hypothetical protein